MKIKAKKREEVDEMVRKAIEAGENRLMIHMTMAGCMVRVFMI